MISRFIDGLWWYVPTSISNMIPWTSAGTDLAIEPLFDMAMNGAIPTAKKIERIKKELSVAKNVKYDAQTNRYYEIFSTKSGDLLEDHHQKSKPFIVNKEDQHHRTLLCSSLYGGDISLASWLIEELGADVNQGLLSPMMIAADHGYVEFMRYLVSKGADINRGTQYCYDDPEEGTTPTHTTALHRAVRFGQVEAVKYLIHRDALLLKDGLQRTPKQLAVIIIDTLKKYKAGEKPPSSDDLLGRHCNTQRIPALENMEEILLLLRAYKKCQQPKEKESKSSPVSLFFTSSPDKRPTLQNPSHSPRSPS